MCGIAGKILFGNQTINKNKEVLLIKKTLKKLHHRGPDDQGYTIDKNVWLGATRLSIIDLTPSGRQPLTNEDGSVFLVFNGEIYNYLELKKKLNKKHKFKSKTDSEVLVHLYEEYGIDCLKYLRGMFSFAIWDKRKKELFLARDRIGVKPLKYYYNNKFFIFASELKAFISHPAVPKEIDWEAIGEFLTYYYVPSPKTGFKDIYKLPPAHYMIVKPDGKIIIKKYWDLDFSHKLDLKEEEWIEIVTNKFKESIKLRLRSDVPLGVHLSGGIDSGIITALVSIEKGKPLDTFSIGFEDSDYNELSYTEAVSQRYRTNHHEFIVKSNIVDLLPQLTYQYEEPFADTSIIPTWYLMKESSKYVTVALNGDGGDENFAGYRKYIAIKCLNFIKHFPFRKKFRKTLVYTYRFLRYKEISSLVRLLNLSNDNLLGNIDDLLYKDINSYLPDCLLVKNDIASMAFSLEVRSPFLDHEFMELCAKIPPNFKLRGLETKYLLKKIARDLIPDKCFSRKKKGFLPPLEHWFRGRLYMYLKSQITDKKLNSYGIFKKEELQNLLEEHKNYKNNHTYTLFAILMLKNWMDVWFNTKK